MGINYQPIEVSVDDLKDKQKETKRDVLADFIAMWFYKLNKLSVLTLMDTE